MTTRTPRSSPQTRTPDEAAPADGTRGRRHAAVWAVAALLALAGCATAESPGRRNHQRRR